MSTIPQRRHFLQASAATLVGSMALASNMPELVTAAEEDEKDKLPEPEDLTLETKDNVSLRCTYYGGVKGKKVVPLVMLHGWGGQRTDFDLLAKTLQKRNCAIIVPDLRGHGESVSVRLPNGSTKTIDREKFRPADMESMLLDVEATKKFLLEKNNVGDVNLESLGVVGAEMGCLLALRWTLADWNAVQLPSYKNGQDVKALVLLSPVNSFKNFQARDAFTNPIIKGKLSILIAAGKEDPKGFAEAKRIYASLSPHRPKPPTDPDQRYQKTHDLELIEEETKLQGTQLLQRGLKSPSEIVQFIGWRLNAKQADYEWTERRRPGS